MKHFLSLIAFASAFIFTTALHAYPGRTEAEIAAQIEEKRPGGRKETGGDFIKKYYFESLAFTVEFHRNMSIGEAWELKFGRDDIPDALYDALWHGIDSPGCHWESFIQRHSWKSWLLPVSYYFDRRNSAFGRYMVMANLIPHLRAVEERLIRTRLELYHIDQNAFTTQKSKWPFGKGIPPFEFTLDIRTY